MNNVVAFKQKGSSPKELARDILSRDDITDSLMLLKFKDGTYGIGNSGINVKDMLFLREMLTERITETMKD